MMKPQNSMGNGALSDSNGASAKTGNTLQTRRPRKVYSGMWGYPEIAVFGFSVLTLFATFLFYVFVVAPSDIEREQTRNELEKLDSDVITARKNYGSITSTENQVARLISSVDEFESGFLPVETTGRTALYQRINSLIQSYGLVNTNGPNYAPLETIDAEGQQTGGETREETGRARFRSLFPGIYVSMTVEGTYQNLRRFIRDIETGNEFVVISSIELAPSESSDSPTGGENAENASPEQTFDSVTGEPLPSAPNRAERQGKSYGERVALRIELAAYFRRAGAPEPEAAQNPQNR